MTLRPFPVIPVLAALASGCYLSAEADVPEVEITQHGLGMPGVPASKLIGDVSVTSSFTFSPSNTAWAKRMNSQVFVHRATVTATSGLANLDFIKSARLAMTDPAISESTIEIISYDQCENAQSSSIIEVSMPTPIDITPLWAADDTIVELQMAGRLPEKSWTVDVTLKLGGKITYKF